MKTTHPVREILGGTQLEMAMLLGVGLSQYAMYEIGQRDLPGRAKKLLANMLSHANAEVTDANAARASPQQLKVELEVFNDLLIENKNRQTNAGLKIAVLEHKQSEQGKLRRRVEYLKTNVSDGKLRDLHQSMVAGARRKLEASYHETLAVLRHRLEVLTIEGKLLEEKIEKNRIALEAK